MLEIGIVGSRAIDHEVEYNVKEVYKFLDYIFGGCDTERICIHSGGARGVDNIAIKYAEEKGFSWKIHKPDFDKHPYRINKNKAYFLRNEQLVDEVECLIAITRGESRGTEYTINHTFNTHKWVVQAEFLEGHTVLCNIYSTDYWRKTYLIPRCEK